MIKIIFLTYLNVQAVMPVKNNLVYNCHDLHFSCLNIQEYENCELNYREILKNDKVKSFDCIPLKTFEDDNQCGRAHYDAIYAQKKKYFCIKKIE